MTTSHNVPSDKSTRCVQRLMAELADLLDADQFNRMESIVQSYGVLYPDMGDDPREDDGERSYDQYR